jgi:alanyl-tRNA synthetase
MMPTASEIRQQFIDYFKGRHGHTVVPSSPVVPHDDPTLLFTNAGMNQFKPYFLGTEQPQYPRAVDTQKCIRAGGKHNDLEDVGKDTYHHTFFEMLGNWSFGDYFKKEAIDWAWDLLVNVWQIDPERLHATYFEGDASEGLEPDTESRDLWLNYLPAERVHPGNKKDNFWEMGDTGPCGPCSEVHYDRTPDKSGAKLVNADAQDNVVEIWNLVFIQFNRSPGSGGQLGKLSPLPAKHVDTGMGFERIVRVLQGKESNYDTDVFTPLFEAIQKVTGARPYGGSLDGHTDIAYRILADHIRCLTFALTDGAVPSNEGRGYVLRRILRRAVRHGRQTFGMEKPFFYKLVDSVVGLMGDAFPELKKDPTGIAEIIREEEVSFGKTIDRGITLFSESAVASSTSFYQKEEQAGRNRQIVDLLRATGQVNPAGIMNVHRPGTINWNGYEYGRPVITAEDAFQLYDTYGFPLDLTQVMAEERGMTVDIDGFNRLMDEAREKSKGGGGGGDTRQSLVEHVQKGGLSETEFVGYDTTELPAFETPLHVFRVGNNCGLYKVAEKVEAGKPCAVVVGKTPFYAEAGGQVGDTGVIQITPPEGNGARVKVTDTIRIGEVAFHLGEVTSGTLIPSGKAKISLAVDKVRRAKIMSNHTTTHVMNRALRDLVNPDAMQKGSLVDDQKLRFDFAHKAALTEQELADVEQQVNDDITRDLPVYTDNVPQDKALKIHSLRAVFGEKYPPIVRVVSVGVPVKDLLDKPSNKEWAGYSIEFCGGTHMEKTGDAEGFCIVSQDAVSKGVRRVTALTGSEAHRATAEADMLVNRAESLLSAPPESLSEQIDAITKAADGATLPVVSRNRLRVLMTELSQKVKQFQKEQGGQAEQAVIDSARAIAEASDGPVIIAQVPDADGKTLRTAMDVIRKKHPESAIFLAADAGGKVALMASVAKSLIAKGLKAGDWIKQVAPVVGGGGGGRPDSAQAGGKLPEKLPDALKAAGTYANDILN